MTGRKDLPSASAYGTGHAIDHERTAEELRASEVQCRAIFDAIDQGFCVVELRFDTQGRAIDYRFVEVNRIFEEQTGLSDAAGHWMRELRPDHEQYWFDVYGQVALTGEPARFEHGAEALGGRCFEVYAFRVGEPALRHVAILFKDISARKRAESAVLASQAQLQSLYDAAPLGICLLDEDLRIRAVNPTALPIFGNLQDPVGRDFDELAHTLWPRVHADEIIRRFRHTLATGESYLVPERIEERLDRAGRTVYEWQTSRIPLPDDRWGVVCYFRDITAQVLAKQALKDADRQKNVFIATLSHELRNPLTSINSAAELLQSPNADAAAREWAARVVRRQSKSMARLLDDLLDVSRLTLGRLSIRREPVNLVSILESALESTRPVIESANHTIAVTMPAAPVTLDADPLRLSQVISNLLSNAARYTEPGGRIDLGVRVESEEVVITITDTGLGIEPSELERVFEIFSQGAAARAHTADGLGIGLALVRGIVELHGGRVSVHSEGSGKGSSFTVVLPRPAATVDSSPRLEVAEHVQGSTARYRILVADDNLDAAEALAMLLQLQGHETRVATNGRQALNDAEHFRPHAAVLDIGMPDLDGYQIARRIRESAWGRDISLFALTGWGHERDKRLAREAGFDVHLTKPVDVEELQARLAEHVRSEQA